MTQIKNINVTFNRTFSKAYDKVDFKIRKSVRKRINIFIRDPFCDVLNNHMLTGEYSGFRSINITGDWRALFIELKDGQVKFMFLGTHSQLYK